MEYVLNILIEKRDVLEAALERYKNNVSEFDENAEVVLINRSRYNSIVKAIKILSNNFQDVKKKSC